MRHVSLLTGDNERTAQAIAGAVGLDEVHAELKPEDKVAAVERLRERHVVLGVATVALKLAAATLIRRAP